jgi:hypothetical protein
VKWKPLCLFLGVAHGLVGKLHGLIDLGKARGAGSPDSNKRERDPCGQAFARALDLAEARAKKIQTLDDLKLVSGDNPHM